MSTISSMANNTYMMLTMAQNNGLNLFGNNSASSSSKSNDIWSNYGSSSSAASAMLSGVSEVSSSKRELLASYDNAAKGFKAEFNATMKDLSSSISDMKKLNLDVGEDAITKKTVTAEDGTTSNVTEYNKAMKEALGTIGEFVDNYNSAIDMFKDYGDVSKRMSYMGTVFGDTTARLPGQIPMPRLASMWAAMARLPLTKKSWPRLSRIPPAGWRIFLAIMASPARLRVM